MTTMFNRSAKPGTDTDERPDWPAGWDDPRSDFYVEPAARPRYRVDAAEDRAAMRNLASVPFPVPIRGRPRTVEPLKGGLDEQLFLHSRRLGRSGQEAASERDTAEREASWQRAHACVVDGIADGASRLVDLPGMIRPERVCPRHLPLYEARSERWVAEQVLPDGRTVGAIVDASFETPKGTKS